MTTTDLASVYRSYIACLNARDWPSLGRFVHDEVKHNGRPLGLPGYLEMLEQDYAWPAGCGSTARRRAVFSACQ